MAKVNPVMKHAKKAVAPTKTMISVEDFMNTIPPAVVKESDGVIDNSAPEWVEIPDTSLDAVVDSVEIADNLDDLAGDVDGITTAASMESYRRIFAQLTKASGLPIPASVGLESFKQTTTGKAKLAKAIRQHADLIRSCANASLEEYTADSSKTIDEMVADFKQIYRGLDTAKREADVPEDEVKIDHKKLWDMWFVDGTMVGPKHISTEFSAVQDLVDVLAKSVDNVVEVVGKEEGDKNVDRAGKLLNKIINRDDRTSTAVPNHKTVQLMFNTEVEFNAGRVRFTKNPTPKAAREFTTKDKLWMAAWGIAGFVVGGVFFMGTGAAVGLAAGITTATQKGGSGERNTTKKNARPEMHAFIDGVKKMGPLVDAIQKHVKELNATIASAPKDRQAVLSRAASPVIEFATKLVAHITELTYGTVELFEKLDQ